MLERLRKARSRGENNNDYIKVVADGWIISFSRLDNSLQKKAHSYVVMKKWLQSN